MSSFQHEACSHLHTCSRETRVYFCKSKCFKYGSTAGITCLDTPAVAKPLYRCLQGTFVTAGVLSDVTPGNDNTVQLPDY